MQIAIPAGRNVALIDAILTKLSSEGRMSKRDDSGVQKSVWFIGRLVFKRADWRTGWCELYPQCYQPLARQVVQPYRAWHAVTNDPHWWGSQSVYMLQSRLRIEGVSSLEDEELDEGQRMIEAMGLRDISWSRSSFFNAGLTKSGRLRAFDTGMGMVSPISQVRLSDGYMVADAEFIHRPVYGGW